MANIHLLALDATRQGGAGVYTARLIMELTSQGHHVTLICHEATADIQQVATVHELPRIVSARPFGLWRLASVLQLRSYAAMLRRLRLAPPDLVIASAQPLAWAYARQFPRVPMVYLPHSFVAPLEVGGYSYTSRLHRYAAVATYAYLERYCLRRSKTTVRFTRAAARAFQTHYGASITDRIAVLPMPIDTTAGTPAPRSDTLRLLVVGRLIPSKNVGFLIDLLGRQSALSWHLDIVGSGPELASLQAITHAAGLTQRIAFHGHCDDVAQCYRQADVFVFPSLLENSPVVLLEAMSHGLPSLSFRPDGVQFHGANDEIVEHETSGLLANDPQHFEALLGALLRGEYDLDKLGQGAQRAVMRRKSWAEHATEIVSFTQGATRQHHHQEAV